MSSRFKSKYRWINSFRFNGKTEGIPLHRVIAERVLGRKLPGGVEIHHIDGNGHNNENSNLVICPDHAYHALLHRRTKALEKCGHADWWKCVFCGKYDAPENLTLYIPKDQKSPRANHPSCSTRYSRERRR